MANEIRVVSEKMEQDQATSAEGEAINNTGPLEAYVSGSSNTNLPASSGGRKRKREVNFDEASLTPLEADDSDLYVDVEPEEPSMPRKKRRRSERRRRGRPGWHYRGGYHRWKRSCEDKVLKALKNEK